MKYNTIMSFYAATVSASLAALNNFSKYDVFWMVFMLGGMFIMIGHSIFDQKVRHSFGKIVWMIVTSFVVCLFIKFLYDERMISLLSMIVSTLISSMVAPATFSIALKELPDRIAEQILTLPEWFVGIAKRKVEKSTGLEAPAANETKAPAKEDITQPNNDL